ncbi:MAG: YcjF family protein [Pseudomonadota bacterium]
MTGSTKRDDDTAPFVLSAQDLPDPDFESPSDAPPPGEDDLVQTTAMGRAALFSGRERSRLGRWTWSVLGLFLGVFASVAAYEYLVSLFARFPAIGFLATALLFALILLVLLQVLRELWAFRRLKQIDELREAASSALASASPQAARSVSSRLSRFYAGRIEVSWNEEKLATQRQELVDADAILDVTERHLFERLDEEARREVEAAARAVAAVTALVPLAFADVLAALSINLRMIRRIATIYGIRAGLFGSWRLLKSVAGHLLATGALAVGDDFLSSMAGGGALSRISRRFGEGVINGALTARVGVAAIEVCRPLPFSSLERPSVRNTVRRAISGLFPEMKK